MEINQQDERKWRRINPYVCSGCGKRRYSFIFTRAKEKLCRLCARDIVPENQPSLFTPIARTLTPREAAKELIRDDVVSGRTCNSILCAYGYHSNDEFSAGVISGGKIEVSTIARKNLDPTVIFKLKEIYNEIVMENKKLKNLNKQALGRGDYENKKFEKDIIKIAFGSGRKKKK